MEINIPGFEHLSTKEKLLQVGIRLFSRYGFEKTTARMIAEAAQVNIATMSFHFGDKEKFYGSVLQFTADQIRAEYLPFRQEVDRVRRDGPMSPAAAWTYIEKYVDFVIDKVRTKDPQIMLLMIREHNVPPQGQYPLTEVICGLSETILRDLLMDYWASGDWKTASVVSRVATSSLISLAEHPVFIRRSLGLEDHIPSEAPQMDEVFAMVRRCVLTQLRFFTPGQDSIV